MKYLREEEKKCVSAKPEDLKDEYQHFFFFFFNRGLVPEVGMSHTLILSKLEKKKDKARIGNTSTDVYNIVKCLKDKCAFMHSTYCNKGTLKMVLVCFESALCSVYF